MKNIIIFIAILFSSCVFATEVSTGKRIVKVNAYSDYGDGDIHIVLDSNSASCEGGYYTNKTNPGYQTLVSMILASYHAKSNIKVKAYPDNKWAGSSSPVCEIYSIVYE